MWENLSLSKCSLHTSVILFTTAQSARQGTVVYTDCISAEEKDSPNECPWYDAKQSDGETLVLELCRKWSTPSLLSFPDPL